MSKALINQDAAYALGEEAFRAGWKARDEHQTSAMSPNARTFNQEKDWNEYEPSEDIKALISDEKPLIMQTSSGDIIEASYDPVTKIMFIKEVKT